MSLRIVEEIPGQDLQLRWHGAPPQIGLRMLVMAMLAVSVFGGLGTFALSVLDKWPAGGADARFCLQAGGATLFLLVVIGLIARTVIHVCEPLLGFWELAAWDAGQGTCRLKYRGFCGYGNFHRVVPLSSIQQLRLKVGSEVAGRDLPLRLQIDFHDEAYDVDATVMLDNIRVTDVDKRPEALDLLFRIARICGLSGYVVGELVRDIEIRVLRSAGDAQEQLQPLPAIEQSARYDLDQVSGRIETPKPDVPEFDLEQARQAIRPTEITTWEPGTRIEFTTPGAPAVAYAIVCGLGAVMGGTLGGFLVSAVEANVFLGVTIGGAAAATGLGIYVLLQFGRRSGVVFDWQRGEASIDTGWRTRNVPLTDVQAIALLGVEPGRAELRREGTPTASSARYFPSYQCRLAVVDSGRETLVVETLSDSKQPEKPFHELAPLAQALAASLSVPWRWVEYGTHEALTYEEQWESPKTAAKVLGLLALAVLIWQVFVRL